MAIKALRLADGGRLICFNETCTSVGGVAFRLRVCRLSGRAQALDGSVEAGELFLGIRHLCTGDAVLCRHVGGVFLLTECNDRPTSQCERNYDCQCSCLFRFTEHIVSPTGPHFIRQLLTGDNQVGYFVLRTQATRGIPSTFIR